MAGSVDVCLTRIYPPVAVIPLSVAHSSDYRRPLGPITEDALEHLIAVTAPNDGIERERAAALLADEGFTTEDTDWALQQLINRGYCYVVDDELYVTDRDVLE